MVCFRCRCNTLKPAFIHPFEVCQACAPAYLKTYRGMLRLMRTISRGLSLRPSRRSLVFTWS